jgi:tetratricopeptide (TPR) repeat protein
MAQRLLDHCVRHDQLEELLACVQERNPQQYAKHAARLRPRFQLPAVYHPSALPELPDELRNLVLRNRAQELALLVDHIRMRRVTTITGMGGIGKTTLVRALIDLRPAEVPPPMWVHFADEPDADLDSLLGKFAGYLGWPELLAYRQERRQPGRGDIARLTDRLLESAVLWLVFDNLENVLNVEGGFCDAGVESLFEALLTRRHQAHLIITGRMLPVFCNPGVAASGFGKSTVELKGLSQADGIALLRNSGLAEGAEVQLARLVRRVDGHPLVLWLLSAEAQLWGVAKLLAESELWQTSDIAKFAHQLFSRLQPAEQRLLAYFSIFRQPQPPSVLVTLAGGGFAGQQAFRLLIRKSLLGVHRSGDPPLYRLHPLVREFAESELDPTQRTQAHLLAYETNRALPLLPASEWRDLDDITPLLEAHHHAIQAGAFGRAAAILLEYALPDYLEQWGAQDRLIKLCRQTFGAVPEGVSYADYLGGVGYDRLLNQDVDFAERARLHRQLGKCGRFLDAYERALECYEQRIALLRHKPDNRELIRLDRESAFVLQRLGRRSEALERCLQGLALAEGARDRQSQIDKAGLHMRAGVMLLDAADAQTESFAHFEQACAIYQELGLTSRAYEAYDNMGVALQRQGCYQEALSYAIMVLQHYENTEHRLGAAQAGLNVGSALHYLKRYEEAHSYYQGALQRFQEIGDQRGCLLSLYNLGELLMDMGDDEAALPYLEQALAISKATSEREDLADILWLVGKAHVHLRHTVSARGWLEQAMTAADQSDNQHVREEAGQLLAELEGKEMDS